MHMEKSSTGDSLPGLQVSLTPNSQEFPNQHLYFLISMSSLGWLPFDFCWNNSPLAALQVLTSLLLSSEGTTCHSVHSQPRSLLPAGLSSSFPQCPSPHLSGHSCSVSLVVSAFSTQPLMWKCLRAPFWDLFSLFHQFQRIHVLSTCSEFSNSYQYSDTFCISQG